MLIVALILLTVVFVAIFSKEKRKPIHTNLNALNTMLLGGLWHGASWNFMIWGGLNGFGILSYKFWRSLNHFTKTFIVGLLFTSFVVLYWFFPQPIFVIGVVWTGALFLGAFFSMLYHLFVSQQPLKWVNRAWAIFMTFVFISFTRLFFRSGSNLDPAIANEEAWTTAKNMIAKIGGNWDFSLIPTIIIQYKTIFILFGIGMIIHWLPDKWKRWYRYNFAVLPIPIMLLLVVIAIFVIYQFFTADFQAFIYFQF